MNEQSAIAFLIKGLLTRVFQLVAVMVAVMFVSLYQLNRYLPALILHKPLKKLKAC